MKYDDLIGVFSKNLCFIFLLNLFFKSVVFLLNLFSKSVFSFKFCLLFFKSGFYFFSFCFSKTISKYDIVIESSLFMPYFSKNSNMRSISF